MVIRSRLFFLEVFIVFCFILILLRLFYWQVIRGGDLSVQASKQYNLQYEAKPRRGQLYFHDKTPLVMNQSGFLLAAHPHEIEDKKLLAKALSPIIAIDEATITASIRDGLLWVPIKHKITDDVKKQIEQLHMKAFEFDDEPLRFYPESSMAAHVVGFVGSDLNGEDKGYFGLEGFYDREIQGKGGTVKTLIDALGRPILLGNNIQSVLSPGRDLVLHLDRTIQFIVESALTRGLEKYQAKGGTERSPPLITCQ